ncbi:MAG: hypothetical protein MR936_18705 [Eubacterium sp.]|uniref:hypothetical protein n=1 Tax=Treponema sp. TaxID=166 RepID=UPI00298D72D0|nr:hypothetical protein [Treponema sp.]MCI6998742.1 hypothetical protein [Eubacterium sp.]MDD5812462.1 hypothetical protein [Treponema sp.]
MSDELSTISNNDITQLIKRAVLQVRPDMQDNPYILEALKVLPVGGYRSAIGAFWNAVVDDLRNKIIFRSLDLFNKEINVGHKITNYDDFINYVNDDQLIEGAYKIGVIGWEAYKLLKHSKEARHIFSGHPKSSDPSIIKVLSVIDDCIKYVLNEEYPSKIIDIDEYIDTLKTENFDRNEISITNALNDLPENYKNELINRLFTIYISPDVTSVLSSNIEFLSPLLWKVINKETKIQITRRVDQEYPRGNVLVTQKAFNFISLVKSNLYLSLNAKKYLLEPLINTLKENLDNWTVENEMVRRLSVYADIIPEELIDNYVSSITLTYVGTVGSSAQWARTDFYANGAAYYIPDMFEAFNDRMVDSFIKTLKINDILKQRIKSPSKMRRLRNLGTIALGKCSENYPQRNVLELLVDDTKELEFQKVIAK